MRRSMRQSPVASVRVRYEKPAPRTPPEEAQRQRALYRAADTTAPGYSTDRVRFLAASRSGYTTSRSHSWWQEPEAVDPAWLDAHHGTTDSTGGRLTDQERARHGVRAFLTAAGPTDCTIVKAKVAWALDISVRTVELGAKGMPDLLRKRGLRSSTTWSVTGATPTLDREGNRSIPTPQEIRFQVDLAQYGIRQPPIATYKEIVAWELVAELDSVVNEVMGANAGATQGRRRGPNGWRCFREHAEADDCDPNDYDGAPLMHDPYREAGVFPTEGQEQNDQ